ncbi:DNA-binding MarR family transcriptional regulator [Paenibacillus sp. V4I3]|uniref:MarR family winged helix-turn-helix transcriptional regulator n=1 Tax=Paenibacillus sp. V4I3 TaxID=3042305 RepID=UPI0027845062|nr:MarR family transcriptional regulator [Paenibacillus sp. V4I3]MDQ0876576.1 DNA-binding MarR family transcriptional regulator [Paenibacillus sp. V4I3]
MELNNILELRLNVQKFIRHFGLLEQTVTPCGFQLSVSQVFALQEVENSTLILGELADRLHLERSSVSRLVDGLVKGGFVSREINEQNRREMLISLTEKGERTIEQVRQQSIRFYQNVLQHMTEADQQLVQQGFEKFTGALLKNKGKQDEI